jgi:hypothetical protein
MSAEAVKFELVHDDGSNRGLTKSQKRRKVPSWHRQHSRRKERRRREAQAWLTQYKREHPCVCGEKEPVALDLHHKGEFKTRDMSRMKTMSQILKELPYCVVMCANCHRKLHAREGLDDQPRLAI